MASKSESREGRGFAIQVTFLVLLLTGIAIGGRAMLLQESSVPGTGDGTSNGVSDHSSAAAASATTSPPIETTEVFAEKDPFNAPIERPAKGDEKPGGENEPDLGPPEGDFPPAPADDPGAPVTVVDVSEGAARISLDGDAHEVREGQIFADHFKLLFASGRCATLLYGDDQFSLCEGQEILR